MFNPTHAARQVIADTSLTDPHDIAAAVFDMTPADQIADLYRTALVKIADEAIRFANMQARKPAIPVMPNKSSKVAAIRAAHIGYFDQRVNVSGEWKMLGDCTVPDLDVLIETRRNVAAKNNAIADEYAQLRDRMVKAGAKVARDVEMEAAA